MHFVQHLTCVSATTDHARNAGNHRCVPRHNLPPSVLVVPHRDRPPSRSCSCSVRMEGGAGLPLSRRQMRGGSNSAAAARVAVGGRHKEDLRQQQRGAVGTTSVTWVGACRGACMQPCRDLALELPSDATVEIQYYGISAHSSPTNSHASSTVLRGGAVGSGIARGRTSGWRRRAGAARGCERESRKFTCDDNLARNAYFWSHNN